MICLFNFKEYLYCTFYLISFSFLVVAHRVIQWGYNPPPPPCKLTSQDFYSPKKKAWTSLHTNKDSKSCVLNKAAAKKKLSNGIIEVKNLILITVKI